ncbi:MAG: OmpA family protein, partial [Gammaproteobacteria bacterium]|nr:OmpA family protein [Gammaproteobacteria bacterium]
MSNRCVSLLLCGLLIGGPAAAQTASQTSPGPDVEQELPTDQPPAIRALDPSAITKEAGDELKKQPVASQAIETVKLTNIIPPIHYGSGAAAIPPQYVDTLRKALDQLRGKANVRVHLIGHADSQSLSPALARLYGDNEGLSRERAGEIAEYLQKALLLPPQAIAYEWKGDTQPVASNDTASGRALNRRVDVEVWYDRPKAQVRMQDVVVKNPIRQIQVCRVETLCELRFRPGQARRAALRNLVPPLHYQNETTDVPPAFIEQIRKALANLSDKRQVVVRLIGYTDNRPLTGRNARIYGDAVTLSKARAQRVALAVQEALKLPSSAVEIAGRGVSAPLASNDTEEGRAANRRVEVQFWYDDPLQELPEGPQLCPRPDGSHVVTKVYDPPWGHIAPLRIVNGQPVIPPGYADILRRAMGDVSGRQHVRLRFIGYTGNKRLDRRTALVYGDDIGLSASRAGRAMDAIRAQMHLSPAQVEHEGRGYVQSPDVVNAGFTQGQTSYVVVQVVYDEPAPLDDYEGVDILRLTRERPPTNPLGLNLMHITVDGKPIDDPDRSSADTQRCTDVALDRANIQFQFDDLETRPRLSASVSPGAVVIRQSPHGLVALPVRFRMYTNYRSFIDRAEVRIFAATQSTQGTPLAVVPVDANGLADWQPAAHPVAGAGLELQYVLRAYGKRGRFDETRPRSLWMIRDDAGAAPKPEPNELLAGYGRSELAVHNMELSGGSVTVRGSGVPAGHTVWLAGHAVPVDAHGNFIAQEVLPTGTQTVEVAVLDREGKGRLYLRDLDFKPRDLFYVGMADLTVSKSHTTHAEEQQQGTDAPFDYGATLSGRLAFFATEKFDDQWRVTASADTRENPLKDLFSNFMSKSPDELFRRIDPDYYTPTFGDDGVVEETAPTLGKLYLKLERRQDYAMWGDFNIKYAQNELARVDRGLYGANGHWQSQATTRFGEKRAALDAFAAEPGTVTSREQFLGTGGSLYFLHNQDILAGSESVSIELRDKDSTLVTGTVYLQPGTDYQIDYLQGRILLSQPLAATADDNMLVRTSG